MSPGSEEQAACPPGPGARGRGTSRPPWGGGCRADCACAPGAVAPQGWLPRVSLSLSLTQHPQSLQAPTSGKEGFMLALSTARL